MVGGGGNTGVIMINAHLSLIALADTLRKKPKGGKAYAFRCVQFIQNARYIHACGYGCQLMYSEIW